MSWLDSVLHSLRATCVLAAPASLPRSGCGQVRRRSSCSRKMLTRIVLLIALVIPVSAIAARDDGYSFTVSEARAAVREHYRIECEEEKSKPRLPYRETFEKAMRGDIKALYTVFTDENYHSGDNESWVGAAWPLVHVVGDKSFAAFLQKLDEKTQQDIFQTIFYSGSRSEERRVGKE